MQEIANNPNSPQHPACDAELVNVCRRLTAMAAQRPQQVAVAVPVGRGGRWGYRQVTFAELERETNRLASGLTKLGVRPGMRLVLMVRPGIEFVALTFALLKSGAVAVLIDPGMGRRNLLQCLEDVQPCGFVAIPLVQMVRKLYQARFPRANLNVTVGRRWFWGGQTLNDVRARGDDEFSPVATTADDPAAIIFTTGSTGPPKGVQYRHGNFDRQVTEIRDQYGIEPGEVDLPGFPLFGLFNAAMGVTTVVPDMDPTRPAKVNPRHIIRAAGDWQVTQSFGSPAIWNVVGQYCERHGETLPTLRRVLSAGAPVPPPVLTRMKNAIAGEGEIHTPYGATEALPVATISASEVLSETAARSRQGAGTCVGRKFPGIDWRVIRITDKPIAMIAAATSVESGEVGELIVRGPVVTVGYVTREEANPLAKIADGNTQWHRMGDVGYLDEVGRFWFCGRKAHRVTTAGGPMFTVPCEAIYNNHDAVSRSALVGVGPAGQQTPVMVIEPVTACRRQSRRERAALVDELHEIGRANSLTRPIGRILFHRRFPVDIRHNAKIFREQLAVWAAGQIDANPHH